MTVINPNAPVMVSGATGYIAGWIIKTLLDKGHTVHAAVRDPNSEKKLASLKALVPNEPDRIKFFKSDLLDKGSYEESMQGCELIYHTASPFAVSVENPQRDLIDPAVKGTENVLESATKVSSVKRVVITSSCAAICTDSADVEFAKSDKLTEEDWNQTASLTHQPYFYSKTLAEKRAWEVANAQSKWDLVVINPSFVIGPGVDPMSSSESFDMISRFGNGEMKGGVPDFSMGTVDVRDVATAHYNAGFTPEASGRYITSATNSGLWPIAQTLNKHFGEKYPIPNKIVPKWLMWIIGPIVTKGEFTRKIISRSIGIPFAVDNSKSIRELSLNYRPEEETVVEMFQQMIEVGRI